MRVSMLAAGLMVLAASTASAGYDDSDLIRVSHSPELVPFAEKVRDLIQQAGFGCDAIERINAYPYNTTGVRAIAYCSPTQGYEGFLESAQIRIVPLQ